MVVTEELRREHRALRQKLDVLEAELRVAPDTEEAIRQMCRSITQFLDEHVRKEEGLLAPYAARIQRALRERMFGDHADERVLLHDLDAVLAPYLQLPMSVVVERLGRLIDELREHLEVEEAEVFPVADRAAEDEAEAFPLLGGA